MRPSLILLALFLWAIATSCTSSPSKPAYKKHSFPQEGVFVGDVKRPYEKLGLVRWRENYMTLDEDHDEDILCKNYYNRAVRSLLAEAKKQRADAVIDVKSVTFLIDGRVETHATAECSDEGAEGQVLVQGVAVKWLPEPGPSPSAAPSPAL